MFAGQANFALIILARQRACFNKFEMIHTWL